MLIVAYTGNNKIREVNFVTGETKTISGGGGGETAGDMDGVQATALFREPFGVAWLADGNSFLVADFGNRKIRRVIVDVGANTAVVSSIGPVLELNLGGAARNIAVSPDGTYALLAQDETISKLQLATERLSTLAGVPGTRGLSDGEGTIARFQEPIGFAFAVINSASRVLITGFCSH